MKACSKCGVVKALGEFYRRADMADGHRSECKECLRSRSHAKYHDTPKATRRARKHAAYRRVREKALRDRKRAYHANSGPAKAAARKWAEDNPERKKKSRHIWGRSNRPRLNAANARRRALQLRATPPWACQAAILAWYEAAHALSAQTGEPFHVDHVIPLQGRMVCGLHVGSNFQILRGAENSGKRNRFEVV